MAAGAAVAGELVYPGFLAVSSGGRSTPLALLHDIEQLCYIHQEGY
ncbi:hypothetical protein [Acidocella aquatica]|nr:hypothetical protein [Acidocella aquatica]